MRVGSVRRIRSRARAAAVGGAVLALLAGCVATSAGDGNGVQGGGIDPGATKQEYRTALAGMAPIELTTQSPAAPGHFVGRSIERYAAAIEAWSGGTITVDVAYSNAIAPPNEVNDALADGRLDFSVVLPLYEPSRYPANSALADVSFLGRHSPVVGQLQTAAGMLEAAFATPEITEELARDGVTMLLPYAPTDSFSLLCAQPTRSLAATSGAQVRVSGAVHSRQAEALGMSPVSLPYTEVYQGLQRGTVDCTLMSLWIADYSGLLPVAGEAVVDPAAGFARAPFGLAFGTQVFEDLPLVAQQLLYDRLDVFIEQGLRGIWEGTAKAAATLDDEGGSVAEFGPDARAALQAANEKVLASVRSGDAVADGATFVRRVSQSLDRWQATVIDDLGYTDAAGYADFDGFYDEDAIDLERFIDRVRADILREHRPG